MCKGNIIKISVWEVISLSPSCYALSTITNLPHFLKQKCPTMVHKANCAVPIIFGIDNKLILIHIGFHRNGEKKEAIGDAYIPDPSYPSRLGVRFSNRKLNLFKVINVKVVFIPFHYLSYVMIY